VILSSFSFVPPANWQKHHKRFQNGPPAGETRDNIEYSLPACCLMHNLGSPNKPGCRENKNMKYDHTEKG